METLKPQFREFQLSVRDFSLWGIVAVGIWDGKDRDSFHGHHKAVELSLDANQYDEDKLQALLAVGRELLSEVALKPGEVQLELVGLHDQAYLQRLYRPV